MIRLAYKALNEEVFEFDNDDYDSVMNEIQKIGAKVDKIQANSLFTYEYIKNNSADWQCHLERMSDFLIFEGVWWKKTDLGIEFLDNDTPEDIPQPKIHHFRSHGIHDVLNDLKKPEIGLRKDRFDS